MGQYIHSVSGVELVKNFQHNFVCVHIHKSPVGEEPQSYPGPYIIQTGLVWLCPQCEQSARIVGWWQE